MTTEMDFCLLGPLMVRRRGVVVAVPPGSQRVLLAALLLNAGRVVRLDELAELLWGPDVPPSGPVAVQNYMMRLRKTLGDPGSGRIITQPRGYLIRVDAGELDASRFEALLGAARAAAREGSWDQAAARAGAALGLWRGEPLGDVQSESLTMREVPRLAEMRLQALQTRIDADLHRGRHADVIVELLQLTAAHPLRERLHSQLMLALYRDGRRAEALHAYQRARQVLGEELGADPGADLRELHQRILTSDPALAAPARVPPVAHAARDVPRELPAGVRHFTGRAGELQALTGLLDRAGDQAPGAVVISAIGGTAGVGKTALAVHWAHQAAERFPDGQLYVNLRGYDPGQPMPAADALAAFLCSLGVPGPEVPPDPDDRATRYRSLLVGRRMLVILDNARSADQVRPLLPGSRDCTVVVTSRDTLAGLVARDGATRLDLDLLPLEEAVALLRTLIGARVDAEPEAAAELADQCCRLPLALRVAAEYAASRPAVPLAGLTAELADLRTRLDLLAAGGDPRTKVQAVFSWSYRHLDTDTARTFRLLGLHPGPHLDPYAAAALNDTTVSQARQALDALARAYLISAAAPGRYGMHDLLRGYARELTTTQDSGQEQHAALTRLFDHYLHTAAAAMDTLAPAERHYRPRIPRPTTPAPPLGDPAAARDWLDGERVALVAAVAQAADGWPSHAIRLAFILAHYLRNGGHYPDAVTVLRHALSAARRTGDRAAEATALNNIGHVDWQQSRFQQAADHHRQALALFRAVGDRAGEARALRTLGLAEAGLGRYEQAARHQQQAAAISRDLGDRLGEGRALGNLGEARRWQGRYQEAAGYHQQTLGLFRELGDREGEAWALARLGGVDLRLGRHQHAAGYLQQALAMFHEMGIADGQAETMARLGEMCLGLGRYEQAARNLEQALDVFRRYSDPVMEAQALNSLGDVLFRTGDPDKARAYHATALRLASEVGSPWHQARAHSGLARTCHADGDSLQARHHWQQALTRYAEIGAPEADEIRARLAEIGDDGDDGRAPTAENGGTTARSPG